MPQTSLAKASLEEGGKVRLVVPPNRKGGDTLSVRHELQGIVYQVVVPEGAVPGERFSSRFSTSEDDTEVEAELQNCAVLKKEEEDENMSVFSLRSVSYSNESEVHNFNEYCTESNAGRMGETHVPQQEGQQNKLENNSNL